ncbi:MAG: ribonuclease HII [bacterium]|nr:ribonuclease HII [bacterium]
MQSNAKRVFVGIDEVGRGPLAGPMVLAAVSGLTNEQLKGIRDSKKLTPKKREEWFRFIKKHGTFYRVCISNKEIDKTGISKTAKRAIRNLLTKWDEETATVLLDGGLMAPKKYKQYTIIKGDEKEPLIAAASVVAKVTRDRMMVEVDSKYPQYGFARHKGYGTKIHMEAIKKHGLSDMHRASFCTRII